MALAVYTSHLLAIMEHFHAGYSVASRVITNREARTTTLHCYDHLTTMLLAATMVTLMSNQFKGVLSQIIYKSYSISCSNGMLQTTRFSEETQASLSPHYCLDCQRSIGWQSQHHCAVIACTSQHLI
jgi:hypothetical protein